MNEFFFMPWFWEKLFYFFLQNDIYKDRYIFAHNFKQAHRSSRDISRVTNMPHKETCIYFKFSNTQGEFVVLCSHYFQNKKIYFQV